MSNAKTFFKNPIVSIKYVYNEKKRTYFEKKFDKIRNTCSDKTYVKLAFRVFMNKKLHLSNPKTFNEKLQWLKLYNRKPEYTIMVDKYAVKEYVSNKIGGEYVIPTIGVWDRFDDIDFEKLPSSFVLKCTHDSGGLVIVKDKSTLNISEAREKIEASLNRDYYLTGGREWPYKNVKPRIIAEKYITDSQNEDWGLTDYKVYCFCGSAKYVLVCLDRHTNDTKYFFFDKNWKFQRINTYGKNAPCDFMLKKPQELNKMLGLAETLSSGIPFVRVDFYISDNNIYFGELTFFPMCGFNRNLLPETDRYFGDLIELKRYKQTN